MAIPTATILRLAAAGTLAGGVTLALATARTPVGAASQDTAQIRELAARVEAQQGQAGTFAPLDVPAGPAPVPQVVKPVKRASSTPRLGVQPPVLPRPTATPPVTLTRPAPPQPKASQPAPAPAVPEDPAKNVALLGITHVNGEDSAWLVDLRDQDREILEVGEQAFGFTLKDIEEDHVVLARGGDEITLHLGEKQIASNVSASAGSSSAAIEPLGGTGGAQTGSDGGGRGRGFGRGGFGGRGFGASGFGSFGGGSGGGFGGRSRSGRSGGYTASSGSSPSTGSSSFGRSSGGGYNASRSGSGRSAFGGGGSTGSFGRSSGGGRSSGFGGSGFAGGGQNGGQSQFSSTSAVTSTSNPQTARRRGARLSGDAAPIETPAAVTNPQTTRRLGTSSSGAAFGQDSGTVGSQRGGRTGR